MADVTPERIAKLPNWAQEYIAELQSGDVGIDEDASPSQMVTAAMDLVQAATASNVNLWSECASDRLRT